MQHIFGLATDVFNKAKYLLENDGPFSSAASFMLVQAETEKKEFPLHLYPDTIKVVFLIKKNAKILMKMKLQLYEDKIFIVLIFINTLLKKKNHFNQVSFIFILLYIFSETQTSIVSNIWMSIFAHNIN